MKKAILVAALGALAISGQVIAADLGEQTYKTTCFACHGTGAAGAPKLGDKAAWGPRIAQGQEVLYTHSLKGYKGKTGVMLPKGGNPSIPDANVKAAVDYMVKAAQ